LSRSIFNFNPSIWPSPPRRRLLLLLRCPCKLVSVVSGPVHPRLLARFCFPPKTQQKSSPSLLQPQLHHHHRNTSTDIKPTDPLPLRQNVCISVSSSSLVITVSNPGRLKLCRGFSSHPIPSILRHAPCCFIHPPLTSLTSPAPPKPPYPNSCLPPALPRLPFGFGANSWKP
jgi:hypothetical protein